MSQFNSIVITKKGQALMAKMLAGTGNVKFTKIATSTTEYTDSQLESLTSLSNIKQNQSISKITRQNDVAVKIEAAIDNQDLKTGYYIKTVGIYANDPNDGEILYGVMTASVAGWLPPYNGLGISSCMFNLTVTVGNSSNVSLTVSSGAVATINDIQNLQNQITSLQSFIGFSDDDIYGVEVDFTNKTFTRLAGAENLTAGEDFNDISPWGGRKRCNVTDDGKVVSYYGEAGYTETGKLTKSITIEEGKYAGTYAVGTSVQVMVEQPKFYYKVVPLKLEPIANAYGFHMRKARYYVSPTPKEGFKLHPAFEVNGRELEKIYLSAFEASLYDKSTSTYILNDEQVADFATDLLSSIANAKPASGLTQNLNRTNTRTLAHNRGVGWEIAYASTVAVTQLLFLIEYATFNMQSKLGNGVTTKTDDGTTSMTEVTGATTNLGNKSGSVTNDNGFNVVTYRGEENFYGNIWAWIDGMNVDRNSSSDPQVHDLYIANYGFKDNEKTSPYEKLNYQVCLTEGYTSAFGYDEKFDWLFVPTETKGNSSVPVGDYFYRNANYNGMLAALLGGKWSSGAIAGGFYLYLSAAASDRYRDIGGRLVYVPQD